MPDTVSTLWRRIGSLDGQRVMLVPVRTYASKEAADRASVQLTRDIQRFLPARLIAQTGENSGMDTGLGLAEFLRLFGIGGFQHVVETVEVEGDNVIHQPKPPGIILPR